MLWHVAENLTTKYSAARANFSHVACSTTDENLIAAGSGGSIILIRLKSPGIDLTWLRIFQKNISHMAWQPKSKILCITSEKGELSLWDMAVPKCLKTEKVEYNSKNPLPVILPVLWADEKTLISRNGNNVISATFEKIPENEETIEWEIVHSQHTRPIFALARASSGGILWSFASNRCFVGFNLETKKTEKSIGNLYGGCVCGAVSPHDPNLVAFGGADSCVRVWNVTEPTGSCSVESRNISGKSDFKNKLTNS